MPISRALSLVIVGRAAQEQSVAAIRASIRLLRQPTYPHERSAGHGDRPGDASAEPVHGATHDACTHEGYHRDRRIVG